MVRTPEVTESLPQRIFSPIASNYDRPALLLSLFQYRRWHRYLLSRIPFDGDGAFPANGLILDMATGTGAVALDILRRSGVRVVAADVTRAMLLQAQQRAVASGDGERLRLVECDAESPPFKEAAFDAVVSTYLLRYVEDVPRTLACLSSLVKPGGTMASLDFAVPRGIAYPLWRLYTLLLLPAAGQAFSGSWRRTGNFLGPSIRGFYRRWPEERLLDAWRDAGMEAVQMRRLTLGGATVVWGKRRS